MKKFITLVISGSLSLAAAALAQQPDETQQEQHGHHGKKNQSEQTTAQPGATTTNQAGQGKQRGGRGGMKARQEKAAESPSANATGNAQTQTGAQNNGKHGGKRNRGANAETNANSSGSPEAGTTNAGAGTNTNANENLKGGGKHGRNARNKAAANESPAGGNAAAAATASPATTNTTGTANQTNANTGANPNANVNANAGAANVNANGPGRGRGHGKNGKQVDQQTVQKVKTEHASFKAQPRPDKAPAVQFHENNHIENAHNWQGPSYSVFRDYHSERHDRGWYHQHYPRVELIAGGYYYWNAGYWYPAWGYDPGAQYYAYDGPIYTGRNAQRPPDQVIADVQAELQDLGYYSGEVDGLLGPLTRQALTEYQSDNGLYQTAAIDEPTLDSLDLSS